MRPRDWQNWGQGDALMTLRSMAATSGLVQRGIKHVGLVSYFSDDQCKTNHINRAKNKVTNKPSSSSHQPYFWACVPAYHGLRWVRGVQRAEAGCGQNGSWG